MTIKILGAESLGVRGLSCSVELKERKIFIDPGIALGWLRNSLLPHPFQVAIGVEIKERIIKELQTASDVVLSHFHGDHCPLHNPNPYQLGIQNVENSLSNCRIWAKDTSNASLGQRKRREDLTKMLQRDLRNAEGMNGGALEFSLPVSHGRQGRKENTVIMSKIEEDGVIVVHASDIQLLDEYAIDQILNWKPDIVLASGPPLYRYSSSTFQIQRERAWENATRLAQDVATVILDHHLLRSGEGAEWLEQLQQSTKHIVLCAAEFMDQPPILLEAWRPELYKWLPVPENWHKEYAEGKVDPNEYLVRGWDVLLENGRIADLPQ